MKQILEKYSWKHIVILYDTDYVFFNLAGSSLARDFKADADLPRPLDIPFRKATLNNKHKELLTEANQHARGESKHHKTTIKYHVQGTLQKQSILGRQHSTIETWNKK